MNSASRPVVRTSTSLSPVLSLLCLVGAPATSRAQCDCPALSTYVVGHRGMGTSWSVGPYAENTLESVLAAFEAGADMAEVDVHMTVDDALVLMHDDTVDRTTNGTGCLRAASLEGVRALEVPVTGGFVRVPTLDDLLDVSAGRDLNIEVKVHTGSSCPEQDLDVLADSVVAALGRAAPGQWLHISSFHLGILEHVRERAPAASVGLLSFSVDSLAAMAAAGHTAYHPRHVALDEPSRAAADALDLPLFVWTVNETSHIDRMLGLAVDGIITDQVARTIERRAAFCTCTEPGEDGGMGPTDGGVDGGMTPDEGTLPQGCGSCATAPGEAPVPWSMLLVGAIVLHGVRRSVRRA